MQYHTFKKKRDNFKVSVYEVAFWSLRDSVPKEFKLSFLDIFFSKSKPEFIGWNPAQLNSAWPLPWFSVGCGLHPLLFNSKSFYSWNQIESCKVKSHGKWENHWGAADPQQELYSRKPL